VNVIPGLTGSLLELVIAVQTVLRQVVPHTLEPEAVMGDRARVNEALQLVVSGPGMSVLLPAHDPALLEPSAEHAALVRDLLAADPAVRAHALGRVHAHLDSARRDVRRGARRARRTPKQPREDRKLADAQALADKAEAVEESFLAANAELAQGNRALRARVAELEAELLSTRSRLDVATTRLQARQQLSAPDLASALADALDPPARAGAAKDRRERSGSTPVTPGRGTPAPAVDDRELTRLARYAGAGTAAAALHQWLPALLRAIASPPREYLAATDLDLRVEVLGAFDEVAGSAVLVSGGGTRVLIDAGTRPGRVPTGPKLIDRVEGQQLDAIVVTHAHNDHVGWVPRLLAGRESTPVYATMPTIDLMGVMLPDSAKVMAGGAGRVDGGDAPYGLTEVGATLSQARALEFGHRRRVGDLDVELFPAGHIVGAAGVVVHAGGRRVVISGDVSGPGQLTVGGFAVPDSARGADLLLLESTYGGVEHVPRARAAGAFVQAVRDVVAAGGRVLVPAFALGRAQEIVMLLARDLPEVPVLIDGLARAVTQTYESATGPDGGRLRLLGGNVRLVERTREAIETLESGVVVATSGMLNGGPALAWAREILPNPADAVLVVGYQDASSPLRAVLEVGERGKGEPVMLRSQPGSEARPVPVRARVERHQLGAHAAAPELSRYAAEVAAVDVSLVHGEPFAQAALRQRLAGRGARVVSASGMWRPQF
jgi:Cft2 family RNA processing exonuclease